MKKQGKIIAVLLALLMILSVLPVTALASSSPSVEISFVVQPKSSSSSKGKNPDTIYYFKDGVGTPNYTGVVNINGTEYYVQNGKVATNYSGKKTIEGRVYTIKDGVVVSVSVKDKK